MTLGAMFALLGLLLAGMGWIIQFNRDEADWRGRADERLKMLERACIDRVTILEHGHAEHETRLGKVEDRIEAYESWPAAKK